MIVSKRLYPLSILAILGFIRLNAQNNSIVIRDLLSCLTLEEKIRLLVGNGYVTDGQSGRAKQRILGAVGTSYPIERLHIPSIVLSDGPAGGRLDPIKKNDSVKIQNATGFPVTAILASA